MLELKLQSLRHHYDDMSAVTSDLAQMCMKGQIHRLDGDITQQRQHCQEIMIQIQAAQAAAQAEAQAAAEAAKAQQLREEEKMEEDLVEEDLGVEVDKEMVEEVEGATALPEVETHPRYIFTHCHLGWKMGHLFYYVCSASAEQINMCLPFISYCMLNSFIITM